LKQNAHVETTDIQVIHETINHSLVYKYKHKHTRDA